MKTAALFVYGLIVALTPGLSAADVVASGLNNPRGIAFSPDGGLYVAEAGTGGSGVCITTDEGQNCFGLSGSITRIDLAKHTQTRVATGLPSTAAPDGTFALGPHDIGFKAKVTDS